MDTKLLLQDIYLHLLDMKSQTLEYEALMQQHWQSAEADLVRAALQNLLQKLQQQITQCSQLLSSLNNT